MGNLRLIAAITVLISTLLTQGCVFAPSIPDPQMQQSALESWKRCMARFDANPEHYCDGHRRDILATYPVHLENQINSLLSHTTRIQRASQLIKTGLKYAPAASEHYVPDALIDTVGTAQKVDL